MTSQQSVAQKGKRDENSMDDSTTTAGSPGSDTIAAPPNETVMSPESDDGFTGQKSVLRNRKTGAQVDQGNRSASSSGCIDGLPGQERSSASKESASSKESVFEPVLDMVEKMNMDNAHLYMHDIDNAVKEACETIRLRVEFQNYSIGPRESIRRKSEFQNVSI